MSSRLVSQQPSRKNPVMGFIEQSSSRSPRTFRGPVGRSPLFQLSSLSIVVSWVAAMSDSSGGDFLLPLGSTGNRRGMTTTRHRGYRISNRYEKRYNLHWDLAVRPLSLTWAARLALWRFRPASAPARPSHRDLSRKIEEIIQVEVALGLARSV